MNGLAAGQARTGCTVSLITPPLTDDRSAAALGRLFGGMRGALGGIAVSPDGSNINPVALTLLNYKLPDGSFLIPTPQTVAGGKPFPTQGFSVFSEPCGFTENQYLVNADYFSSERSRFQGHFFAANDTTEVFFPETG